jgi:hypothetical protein
MWRSRPIEDLVEDPRVDFMCGRLIGAAEMAALRLQQEGGDLPELGIRLEEMVRWFVETEPLKTSFGRSIQVPRRDDTMAIPVPVAEPRELA